MTPEEQATLSRELYRRMEEDMLDGAIEAAVEFNQEREAAQKKTTTFYRPDQARDEGGKFEDEGKGSLEPGYRPGRIAPKEEGPGHPGKPVKPPTVTGRPRPATRAATTEAISTGEVTERKEVGMGTGGAEFVTLDNGEKGVWKDSKHEKPGVRRNIDGNYYRREAAAAEVAELIGLEDLVPATVVRSIKPGQVGSLQHFVPDADVAVNSVKSWDEAGVARMYDGDKDLARAAAFDYLIGNMDRHAKNWMIGKTDGRLHLIDNGLSFPNEQGAGYVNQELYREAHHRDLSIPPEVRSWRKQYSEQIRTIIAKRGLSQLEAEGVMGRARDLEFSARFADLPEDIRDAVGHAETS